MLSACRSNSMSTPVPSLQREEGRGGGREVEREEDVVYTCMHVHTHTHTHTHLQPVVGGNGMLHVEQTYCVRNNTANILAILWCYRMHTHMLLQL